MEHWLVLNSDSSDEYYPSNTPSAFTIYLNQPLVLDGYWAISLREFYASRQSRQPGRRKGYLENMLYVYCSLCEPIIVDGGQKPLLRRVNTQGGNNWSIVFDSPFYIKTRLTNAVLHEVNLYITDCNGNPASFLKDKVSVTLHLKHYSDLG